MGIYSALTTAVAGLRAQSFALENISGNIANSQTTGYKRTDTSFSDLIPESLPGRQSSGSVNYFSRSTNTVQGEIQAGSSATFMAINGDGYFQVTQKANTNDGTVSFNGLDYYTRRGDFEIDKDGFLVNGSGYYLKALDVDRKTGSILGTVAKPIQMTSDVLPAKQTLAIKYRGNLPAYPKTQASDPTVANSELLDTATLVTAGAVTATNSPTFVDQSISGGAITIYDAQGAPVNVQIRWGKTANASAGPPPVEETWRMYYLSDPNATGAGNMWTEVNQDFTFDAAGKQTAPATATLTLAPLTVGTHSFASVDLDFGSGLTQFADTNGSVNLTTLTQDGYAAGQVSRLSIGSTGRITAFYTNGQVADIAQIPIVSFSADNQLKKLDGGVYTETVESGPPIPGAPGKIAGSSLEASNTDVADEFTKLIVTQQAYSANTRIVSSADQMLQEALNMKR